MNLKELSFYKSLRRKLLTLCGSLLIINPHAIRADSCEKVEFTSPYGGQICSPGQTITVSREFHYGGHSDPLCVSSGTAKVRITYSYTSWNNGWQQGTITESTEDKSFTFKVPCDAVVSSVIRFTATPDCNRPSDHEKALEIVIDDTDLNLPPETTAPLYVSCSGAPVTVNLKDQRVHHKPVLTGAYRIAEERYMRWYEVDEEAVQNILSDPEQLRNYLGGLSPVHRGYPQEGLSYTYTPKTGSLLIVTAEKVRDGCEPSDNNDNMAISQPTVAKIANVPDVSQIIPVKEDYEVVNDNNIPCPDVLDCIIPKTYADLPGPDLSQLLVLQTGGTYFTDVKTTWYCDKTGRKADYFQLTNGNWIQRVCYDDLTPIEGESDYTAEIIVSGYQNGEPFTCIQYKKTHVK